MLSLENMAESNFEDLSRKEISQNLEILETLLCDVYYQALKKILDIDEHANILQLKRFTSKLNSEANNWCGFNNSESGPESLLKDSLYYRFTCIQRKGILLSSAVAYYFQNALKRNPSILHGILQKKVVKICSIGCGLASDVVAIVAALAAIAKNRAIELDFRVTVIGPDDKWKTACISLLKGLEQFKGPTSKIGFINGNLSRKLEPSILQEIEDADIVTMVDCVSEGLMRYGFKMVKNVTITLKSDAIFFVLDQKRNGCIKPYGGYTGELDELSLIYEEINEFYALYPNTIEKILLMFRKYFKPTEFQFWRILYARVWCKTSEIEGNNMKHPMSMKMIEKFNAQRDCLNAIVWSTWEREFSKKMTTSGWTARGIQKYLQKLKTKRSSIFNQYFKVSKSLDSAKDKLLEQIKQAKGNSEKKEDVDDSKQVTEIDWKSYYDAKLEYNLVKQETFQILINHLYKTTDEP